MSTDAVSRLLVAFVFSISVITARYAAADPVSLDDWYTSGSAVIENGEIILTTDTANQSGAVMLNHIICANKFRLSFDLNVGVNTATKGGLGIGIFARSIAGELAFRAHADSSFQSSEDQRYELNDNHVSLDTMWAPTDSLGNPPLSGNSVFGPIAAARMPFLMKAAGWFHGEMYRDGENLQLTFTDGTSGLLLNGTIYPEPGESFFLGFSADTSTAAHNLQRVRDVHLDIIDRSECSDYVPPYTREEAQAEINNRCGNVSACPAREAYLTCVQTALGDMLQNEQVSTSNSEFLLLETQYGLTFCDGYQQCETENDPATIRAEGYSAGYSDGAASIDQNAIRTAGYNSGYSAGSADGRSEGYSAGYGDGESAGYSHGYSEGQAAGDSAGYARGYSAGNSAGTAAGYDSGYAAGRTSGLAEGKTAGYSSGYTDGYKKGLDDASGQCTLEKAIDELKNRILTACPCPEKKSRGNDYMSCTRNLLSSMRRSGEIDSRLESYMYESVRVNQCRGELRFRFPWWSW